MPRKRPCVKRKRDSKSARPPRPNPVPDPLNNPCPPDFDKRRRRPTAWKQAKAAMACDEAGDAMKAIEAFSVSEGPLHSPRRWLAVAVYAFLTSNRAEQDLAWDSYCDQRDKHPKASDAAAMGVFSRVATVPHRTTLSIGRDVWQLRGLNGVLVDGEDGNEQAEAGFDPIRRMLTVTQHTSNETLGELVATAINESLRDTAGLNA